MNCVLWIGYKEEKDIVYRRIEKKTLKEALDILRRGINEGGVVDAWAGEKRPNGKHKYYDFDDLKKKLRKP